MQGTGGRCLIFLPPNILINPVFFQIRPWKAMLDPKAKMADRAKRLENIIPGNKRETKGAKIQIYRPRRVERVTTEQYLTFLAQSKIKFLKNSKVHRPLGRSKELKDKQN